MILYYDSISNFGEELCGVKKDGKWGFIDKTGKVVTPINSTYDRVESFHQGLCPVIKDEKWGASIKRDKKLFLSDFMILFGLSVRDYVGS